MKRQRNRRNTRFVSTLLSTLNDVTRDHETLSQLRQTALQKMSNLWMEIVLPAKKSKEARKRAYRTYWANVKHYKKLIDFLSNAIRSHGKILQVAKSKSSRQFVFKIFRQLIEDIKKLKGMRGLLQIMFEKTDAFFEEVFSNIKRLRKLALL